jgi:hypothetical protein
VTIVLLNGRSIRRLRIQLWRIGFAPEEQQIRWELVNTVGVYRGTIVL